MGKYIWKKEDIEEAVKDSYSYREVLRKMKINTCGNNTETLKKKIKMYGIDTSHFTFHPSSLPSLRKDVNEYLVNGSHIQSCKLKEKLIEAGLKENKCEICGMTEWLGKPLTCQLHHINGNNMDNRLENLQILCPNCHSQTDNYCGQANKKEKEKHYCLDCGRELKWKKAKYCLSCSSKRRQKNKKPTKDRLVELLKKNGGNRLRTAKEIGVSETAIRKWCKDFGLPIISKELKEYLKNL